MPSSNLKSVVDQEGGVGVGLDVVVMDLVVGQQVIDDAAEEGDVGAGADRRIEVGHRGGAREARVDDDELGLARASWPRSPT